MSIPKLLAAFLGGILIIAAPTRAQVAVFQEYFDEVDLPDPPSGWTFGVGWETSGSSSSTGSGLNNLVHKGNAATAAETRVFSLAGATAGTISYLARRTNAYDVSNLAVEASADGGATFPLTLVPAGSAVPGTGSLWQPITVPVPVELLGSSAAVLRFRGFGLSTAGATARIDDVVVTASLPLEVEPPKLSFSSSAGTSSALTVVATNRSGALLSLEAPVVSGSAFSVAPTAGADLAADASQTYTVTFTPADRGTYAGALEIPHALGTAIVNLAGSAAGGVLAFSTGQSEALDAADEIQIPVTLSFNSAIGLQGLQFRVVWTGNAISGAGALAGQVVADSAAWTISHEAEGGIVDVVLLGSGTTSLPGGTYDSLLTLSFVAEPGAPEGQIPLQIENVIGALATPNGADADLEAAAEPHVVTIRAGAAFFSPSARSLDIGDGSVGSSTTMNLTVSNPGGTTALDITEISLSNSLFSITPATATIPPDSSASFAISFQPTPQVFGRQDALITFTHNGQGGTDDVSITGLGVGGRGDAGDDGSVDVADIVLAIDFVLGRLVPGTAQLTAADLFPFPDGDGELDVRDLTVMAQAIARGRWPDDIDLPIEEQLAGKSQSGLARLSVTPEAVSTKLELTYDVPIRAFQVVLPADPGTGLDATMPRDTRVISGYDDKNRELRLLVYRSDGGLITGESLEFSLVGRIGQPRYVAVIDADRERVPVQTVLPTSVEHPDRMSAAPQVFPNPFHPGRDAVRIRTDRWKEPLDVVIFDVLGRRVFGRTDIRATDFEWDGRDAAGHAVAAGLYLVTLRFGKRRVALPVVAR